MQRISILFLKNESKFQIYVLNLPRLIRPGCGELAFFFLKKIIKYKKNEYEE